MGESEQNMGDVVVPEYISALENASFYVELGVNRNLEMHSKMLETMRSLKANLESLKTDNLKLMNAKSYQEKINELILKSLIDPQKNNGQNSCSIGKKRKGVVQCESSEETTENIHVIIKYLKKDKGIKVEKQKEHPVELQGEIKKLRPSKYDGELEKEAEYWLLSIK